ncbi:hypothetical protein DCS_07480 [Drechmeria coniospora]|uniref:Uncharacterized protein n=1 Tax=Drechmeria coniospora TaxID=98403 RepID=A0A151GEJ2_DRECN|nr:hypothetical protein DCS_07480 [Drechmeria coniospora]KYK55517.1 hypothetical protein DCS_07480 [Drechmeria coniospora]
MHEPDDSHGLALAMTEGMLPNPDIISFIGDCGRLAIAPQGRPESGRNSRRALGKAVVSGGGRIRSRVLFLDERRVGG